MAWISGRTLSPISNELVFWINENAQLPGPQNWEQLWQVCSGIEPPARGNRFTYSDQQLQIRSNYESYTIQLSPSEYVKSVSGKDVAVRVVAETDIDPLSDCRSYRRTVTVSVVNFEINDEGDSFLETEGCISNRCDTISVSLKTRGRNPSKAVLNAAFPDDILRAISWRESTWRHFLPSGKPLFNRNSNGTTDWGLMQINEATNEQRWNWKANLSAGITILREKRGHAKAYLDRHGSYSAEMLENEMIQRYNGGAYHKWDPTTGNWVADPPNGYVASIRSLITGKPWQTLLTRAKKVRRPSSRKRH